MTPPDGPHRRLNPLTGEWILVSAGRTKRPWQGRKEPVPAEGRPAYDPNCYLCPGNTRANGDVNPAYARTFVFTNDFAALRPETPAERVEDGLLIAAGERGTCRVVCFSPRHDLTLGQMPAGAVRDVVDLWASESEALGASFPWVQVFENRGESMGASNPHPHGQIWAAGSLPREAVREMEHVGRHHAATGSPLLLAYADQESGGPRVVEEGPDWLVVVPFWAAWPFETLVLPRRPARRLADLDDTARDELAATLGRLLRRYDGLFARPFPYSMGWHQAPFGPPAEGWQLHAHFYPPLLHASVRKFMVGYELLSEAQRDITAEDAAARLREVEPDPAVPIATPATTASS